MNTHLKSFLVARAVMRWIVVWLIWCMTVPVLAAERTKTRCRPDFLGGFDCTSTIKNVNPAFMARGGGLTSALLDHVQHRQAQFEAEQAEAKQLLLSLLQSGQYVISQPGDPVDVVVGGASLTRSDHLHNHPLGSSMLTKFCPIGGERYEETIRFCPTHAIELRTIP